MKGTKQLAFCGIISAISVALMFISGIFSFLSYAIPGICGALLIMVIIDISKSKSFLIYIVVGILSLLIVTNKTSVLAYILLLGYYPILKFFIENIENKFFELILKLLVFLVSLALFLVIASFFVGLDLLFSLGTIILSIVLFSLILMFFLYDFCLSLLIEYYKNVLKPRLFKNFFK